MDADALCAFLDDPAITQRTKLEALRGEHLAAIQALSDPDHKRVVRAIKKRIKSPKLTDELFALVGEISRVYAPEPVAPEPEPAAPPVPVDPFADDAHELVAAIYADPGRRDNYMVYGDWLQSKGDPRGELIAIGAELTKNPEHAKMKTAHAEHLHAHPELLGPLADCEDVVTEITWFMGYIDRCRVAYTLERFNGDRRPDLAIPDVLRWLLDDPAPARFLQHLTVGLVRHDDNVYTGVTAALAAKPRPTLRTLFLGDFGYEDCELNWTQLGDLSPLWPAVPNLRELTLRAGQMAIGPISLPALETLTTITGGLDGESLRQIAAAEWPSLTELSLQVGPSRGGATRDPTLLAPLLAGDRVPKLTALGIRNCEFTDELCRMLVTSPLLPQLTRIDLDMGTMGDEGAEVLAGNAAKLAHVKLDVDDNYLTDAGKALLEKAFGNLHFGMQRDEDDGRRYASAYE